MKSKLSDTRTGTGRQIKKLHLNIPEVVHQRLRVKCAIENRTMQDFVSELIEDAVKDVRLPRARKERL